MVLDITNDFQLLPGHFVFYVIRLYFIDTFCFNVLPLTLLLWLKGAPQHLITVRCGWKSSFSPQLLLTPEVEGLLVIAG